MVPGAERRVLLGWPPHQEQEQETKALQGWLLHQDPEQEEGWVLQGWQPVKG